MYDLIGDVHGHADELESLLDKMGYVKSGGVYSHRDRRAIFLGDYIDRGPKIERVLEIVRSMVDNGHALAILGNHEFNALAFHTPKSDGSGEFLRPHTPKNVRQHAATLEQLGDRIGAALEWFRTLPIALDLGGLRAVHACWNPLHIAAIARSVEPGSRLGDDWLRSATASSGELAEAIESTLKGPEAPLPFGKTIADKDGHMREYFRVRWFADPAGQTYRSYAMPPAPDCREPLGREAISAAAPYPESAPPVFVGHYWLTANRPARLACNVACLDYSVAKGGFLCGYRWDGERILSDDRFVWT